MSTSSAPTKTKALCVATRCTTVDQFVATYHRFCDETSFFVATLNTRPIGLDTAFSIQLADNTPVLRGLCTIVDTWTTPDNQWNRPGIRLGIRRLTPDSVEIFARLKAARIESAKSPRRDSTPIPVRTLGLITPAVLATPPPPAVPGIVLPPPLIAAAPSPPPPSTAPPSTAPPQRPSPVVIMPRAHGLPALPPGATPDGVAAEPQMARTVSGEVSAPAVRPSPLPPIAPSVARAAIAPPGSLPSIARTATPPPGPLPSISRSATPPAISRSATPPAITRPVVPAGVIPEPVSELPTISRTKTPPGLPAMAPAPASELPAIARTATPSTPRDAPAIARTKTPPPGTVPVRTQTPPLGTPPTRVAPTAITRLTPAPLPKSLPPIRPTESKTPTLSLPIVTRPPAPATPPFASPVVADPLGAPEPIIDGPSSSPAPVASVEPEPDTTRTQTPPPGIPATPLIAPPSPLVPRSEPRARTPDFNEMLAAPGAFALMSEPDSGPVTVTQRAPRPDTAGAVTLPVLDLAEAAPIAPPDNLRHPTREITTHPPSRPEHFPDEPSIVVAREAFAPAAAPAETRTPGSDIVLPANPLANLSDDQLQGFIDCTIYEDTSFFDSQDASVDIGDGTAVTVRPSRTMTPPSLPIEPDPRPFRSSTGVPFALGPDGQPIPPQRVSSPAFAAVPEPPPSHDDPTRTMPPWAYPTSAPAALSQPAPTGAYAPMQAPPQSGAYAAQVPAPTGAYPPMASPPQPPMYPPTPGPFPTGSLPAFQPAYQSGFGAAAPRPRWWLIGGSVAIALIVVVIVIRATRAPSAPAPEPTTGKPAPAAAAKPSSKPARTAAREPERTGPDRTVREPAGDPAGDPEESPDDASEPPTSGGLPVVGSGPCRVNVTVTPAGSQVKIDGEVVGVSPLSIETPCDKRRLDIAHVRYATVTRWVTPVLDKPETVEVALVRPTHSLTVVTVPPGAMISIEGRRAGVSPTVVQLMGYYEVTLKIEKKGFKTATQRVYSKLPQDRVTVRLLESFK